MGNWYLVFGSGKEQLSQQVSKYTVLAALSIMLVMPNIVYASATDQLQNTFVMAMAARHYPPSEIAFGDELSSDSRQVTYKVFYTSDRIRISGLLSLPAGQAPHGAADTHPLPGIVIAHGYYDPAHYFTGQGTRSTAEGLAREGYVVLMPDYRGYGESAGQHNPYLLGEEYDVLFALESLRALPYVDDERVGLIGYSWGGGIAVKAAEAAGARLACLADYYGNLGGDVINRRELALYMQAGLQPREAGAMEEARRLFLARSPLAHTDLITCPVLIVHGAKDTTVTIEQSRALHDRLQASGADVTFITLPDEAHAFGDNYENAALPDLLAFLRENLGNQPWTLKRLLRGKARAAVPAVPAGED